MHDYAVGAEAGIALKAGWVLVVLFPTHPELGVAQRLVTVYSE